MICSWFKGVILAFLHGSAIAMGCLFGCFRAKDDHRAPTHLVSGPLPSNAREPVASRNRNRLYSLLLSEDNDVLLCKDKESFALGTPPPDIEVGDLQDEAKFLKACGTLPETPAEIRKVTEKLEDSTPNEDSESLKFHSWLPNTAIQKLNLDKKLDQLPIPIKLCEEWVKESGSSVHSPSSCITSVQNTTRISTSSNQDSSVESVSTTIQVHVDQTHKSTTSSVSLVPLVASSQCRNKSVRFDCESDASSFSSKSSSSEIGSQKSMQSESAGNQSVSKPSPYLTPLKLTDEIQTPGTVFSAYLGNMDNGKNPRIRSQYVYSVLNPAENFSQWKVLKEEDSNSNQLSGHLRGSLEQADKATPKSEVGVSENSVEKESKVEASLSSWLKPPPTNQNSNNQHFCSVSSEKACFGRTPGDRPILGMVAAHWNEAEPSRISPKWWDGKGIPNSTTKYKEDQKVSWHATPFEERLEKALSEETFISQRKRIMETPIIDFDESEECDTALSQLQSSTQFNSVVSF